MPPRESQSPPALGRRTQSRMLALQALCAADALGTLDPPVLERFLRDAVNHAELGWERPPAPDVFTFARTLASGAWDVRTRSDALLKQHVSGWAVQRMQPVDRNILRLGLYELLEHPETPHQVVINEAIELARHFGGADSPAFVNGVLDGIRRALDAPAVEAANSPEAPPAVDDATAPPAEGV